MERANRYNNKKDRQAEGVLYKTTTRDEADKQFKMQHLHIGEKYQAPDAGKYNAKRPQ